MAELSHAKRVLGDISGRIDESQESAPWRKGFGRDNSGGMSPFCLSLRRKDGRHMCGPQMGLFIWHDWLDDGGPTEKLILFFTVGAVYVEGFHMRGQVEALLQEGKLKWIQEHDRAEVEAIRSHNLDTRNAEEKEPIVLRIIITPDLETRLKSSKHLAVIAAALKGENGNENRDTGNAE